MIKVLNLYSGIGGNRKLWTDVEVTAIELDPKIAKIYQDFFPKDKVIVADAHKYLLDHFSEFDFIWSSPPCPSHSKVRFIATYTKDGNIRQKPIYPDMKLYEEILLLKHYFRGKYCVENVVGYYDPLIKPQEFGMHYFWTNFYVRVIKSKTRGHYDDIATLENIKGFDLTKYNISNKRVILRNCVKPELGLHILEASKKNLYPDLFKNNI